MRILNMNESILRSIEKGTFMIKESKKKTEEIYVRIRLESEQIVKVNKSKDGSKKSLKEDESVILELSSIIDLQNSENESLFHRKLETHTNILKLGTNKNEKNLGFRFTIHHGLQFNLKTVSFRAPNTAQYFDWITGLKYLVDKNHEMPYESLVESWLWKHYYEIGESVTDKKIKGPVEIDDEFIVPVSLNKLTSSSLYSLFDPTDKSKLDSNSKWSEENVFLNQENRNKLSIFNSINHKQKNHTPSNLHHFRRYSWCSNVSSVVDSSSQRRFASPDFSGHNLSSKSFNIKISPKQLGVWLAQQNGTKIAIDSIKEYNSNYPPKPNFIDFSGFMKIYKELLYQPETFAKLIEERLKKIVSKNKPQSNNNDVCKNHSSLNSVDSEWIMTIENYSLNCNIQEMDLDSLFNHTNSIWDPKRGEIVYQDMDQPLSAYYISTSHNSYLTGDQITSKSSCEAYTRCIQMGCRSVELDCWNGDREPIIYHGNTLTSKIKLADVLQTIRKCAWQKSNYPLILSLEDHCDIQQQIIIAQMMQEVFQDDLLKAPIKLPNSSMNVLPSPNQLKNKVILKHKKLPIDSLLKSGSMNGLNESGEDFNDNILSNYRHSGRMYMRDLFLDTWTPYYFLLSHSRTLVYTEDTSLNDCEHSLNQSSLQKSNGMPMKLNSKMQNVDNSSRFITIDHGEKLAIDCNGCIPSELTNKNKLPNWFYGSLSRTEASNWLLRHWFLGDGTFLIRTSESFPGNYSLSFYRKNKVHHVRICRFDDTKFQKASVGFEHCEFQFATLEDLVEHYQENDMVALDFNIRLRNSPPERFQDNSWFYENPPNDKETVEELLNKIPLVGSFLVSHEEKPDYSDDSEQCRNAILDHFVLSYRGRGNMIFHHTINYDGFKYTLHCQSSYSLVDLIDYFHKNRMSDGIRLKYPADSNMVRKCSTLTKVSHSDSYNKERDSSLDYKETVPQTKNETNLCPSVTANDLLSLHEDQDDELCMINGIKDTTHSHSMKDTESAINSKLRDSERADTSNLSLLGNMEMGNFQLDSDCYVTVTADITNDPPFMFPFDLYIVDFKIQLACETERQRSDWINAINNCLDVNIDRDMHLLHRKKEIQHKIAKPLSDLIIYCSSVPFSWPENPDDFAKFLNSPCREMSSVSENRFFKLFSLKAFNAMFNHDSSPTKEKPCNDHNEASYSKLTDVIEYHKLHLTRVYPKATRLDSSNLSPIIPWLSGVQMAAINFQTPDRSLQLNQTLFRDNGGCGYVLKHSKIFPPTQHLHIRLTFLGARHLPKVAKGSLEIEIISVHDEVYEKKTFPLRSEFRVTDLDIPDVHFRVKNPNLAFIRFAFGSDEKLGQKKRMNSCQATFTIRGIRPGIRSVYLRNGFDYLNDLASLLFHVDLSIIDKNKEH